MKILFFLFSSLFVFSFSIESDRITDIQESTSLFDVVSLIDSPKELGAYCETTPPFIILLKLGAQRDNCRGQGICSITPSTLEDLIALGNNEASGFARNKNGKLEIELNKSTMNEQTITNHFDGSFFKLNDSYELPGEVAQALNLENIIISAGEYNLHDMGESFKISF